MNVYWVRKEDALDQASESMFIRLTVRLAATEEQSYTDDAKEIFVMTKMGESASEFSKVLRDLADAIDAA